MCDAQSDRSFIEYSIKLKRRKLFRVTHAALHCTNPFPFISHAKHASETHLQKRCLVEILRRKKTVPRNSCSTAPNKKPFPFIPHAKHASVTHLQKRCLVQLLNLRRDTVLVLNATSKISSKLYSNGMGRWSNCLAFALSWSQNWTSHSYHNCSTG